VVGRANPTVLKRYISLELGRVREAAGIKREQVAEHLGCSLGHVRHLETMHSLPKPAEVRVLLPLYGAGERIDSFLELVDAARRGKDWWVGLPGVPTGFDLYLGMERAAVTIHSYDAMVVPGRFQTHDYAKAVIWAGESNVPEVELGRRLEARMARQDVLTRESDPAAVWCVLDEAVLHRQPTDPRVLGKQLEHLVHLSSLPNVHIQVLPFSGEGLHPGMDGTFEIFTFGPELVGDPGVAYTESRIRSIYYEDSGDLLRYRDTWSRLQLLALNSEESRALLARRAKEVNS